MGQTLETFSINLHADAATHPGPTMVSSEVGSLDVDTRTYLAFYGQIKTIVSAMAPLKTAPKLFLMTQVAPVSDAESMNRVSTSEHTPLRQFSQHPKVWRGPVQLRRARGTSRAKASEHHLRRLLQVYDTAVQVWMKAGLYRAVVTGTPMSLEWTAVRTCNIHQCMGNMEPGQVRGHMPTNHDPLSCGS